MRTEPAAALEQAARLAGPGATVRTVRVLAGGTAARTSLIQTANPQFEVVLREFPPGDDAAGREARVLRTLDGLGGLAPRLLASDIAETADRGSWLLISRLPGAADITPRQPVAQAADGPNEEVAAELERCAGRAQARGGLAAAAAFLEWSVRLTVDPARLVARTLDAAQAGAQAGAFDKALGLLAMTEAWPLDELASARVDLQRGQVALASGMVSDASPLLLKAARRLEPLNPGPLI